MKHKADLIVYNATIYTVDNSFRTAQAMAIADGKILAVGSDKQISSKYEGTELNAAGKYIYPGFIDPHCHIILHGKSFFEVNLIGTTSFEDVLNRTSAYSAAHKEGWITGRGWDQNAWDVKEFPNKQKLDHLFPNQPVYLERVDGHAAIANQKAMDICKINAATVVKGGRVQTENKVMTGILIDAAMELIRSCIPPDPELKRKAILKTQEAAIGYGLTSLGDAWIEFEDFELYQKMEEDGTLKLNVYMMLAPSQKNKDWFGEHGIYRSDKIYAGAFKYFTDGALGSRGAAMVEPYSDDPENTGLFMESRDYFTKEAEMCLELGFQMNSHCIGDASNQMMLEIYADQLLSKNNKRWRIEHAQILQKDDLRKFHNFSILPSIQATHATSDMYWAEERLGKQRIKYAYTYKDLLDQNDMIMNGSDFPVEHINPLYGFYAAVSRKDHSGFPAEGFQVENALSREEALKAMTIWSAYGQFEEHSKGSLEPGKRADFVLLDTDIMQCPIKETLTVKVLKTFINGKEMAQPE